MHLKKYHVRYIKEETVTIEAIDMIAAEFSVNLLLKHNPKCTIVSITEEGRENDPVVYGKGLRKNDQAQTEARNEGFGKNVKEKLEAKYPGGIDDMDLA